MTATSPALATVAAPTSPSTTLTTLTTARSPAPSVTMTNHALVTSLRGADRCLWEHGVYPAGGVGYRDSGQPYDDLPPTQAALLAVRAEVLRAHPADVHEVELSAVGSAPVATVLTTAGSSGAGLLSVPASRSASGARLQSALGSATASGVRVTTRPTRGPDLLRQCALEHEVLAMRHTDGTLVDVRTRVDQRSGQLVATVGAGDIDIAERTAAHLAGAIRVEVGPALVDLRSRDADQAPWSGGDAVHAMFVGSCSDSFLVNGNALLTAQHCGQGAYYNNGVVMGRSFLPLSSVGVDAQLLTGVRPYSNRVWMGPAFAATPSSIPAVGIYPTDLLREGDAMLVSGAAGGQKRMEVLSIPSAHGCATIGGQRRCHLIFTAAEAGGCIAGDSGGPVGIYDPRNGRLISVGIVTAGSPPFDGVHLCAVTDIRAIVSLYDGARIG